MLIEILFAITWNVAVKENIDRGTNCDDLLRLLVETWLAPLDAASRMFASSLF